jgi:hypothetical protein
VRISLCAVVATPPSRSHLARWVAALVLCGSLLAGVLVQEPAPARAAGSARGAGGNAQQYPLNSLNYPPIGAGVETMALQPGEGYAIVLGNNCTAEIATAPRTSSRTGPISSSW